MFLVAHSCTSVIGTRVPVHTSCGHAGALSLKSTSQSVIVLTRFVHNFVFATWYTQPGVLDTRFWNIVRIGEELVRAADREIITECNGPKEGCSVRSRTSGTDRQDRLSVQRLKKLHAASRRISLLRRGARRV